jgi:hypothetical protein
MSAQSFNSADSVGRVDNVDSADSVGSTYQHPVTVAPAAGGVGPNAPRTSKSVSNTQHEGFTPSVVKHITFRTPTSTDVALSSQTNEKKKKTRGRKTRGKRGTYIKFMREAFKTRQTTADKQEEQKRKIMDNKFVASKQTDVLM